MQQQNDSYIKETLFNDLPEDFKKKLVELRNLSQEKFTFGMSHPLKNVCENVSIPDCDKLQNQFSEYVDIFNSIENKTLVVNPDYFHETAKEFTEFKNFYKNNLHNKDVVNEFECLYAMMEERYKEIKEKYTKKT